MSLFVWVSASVWYQNGYYVHSLLHKSKSVLVYWTMEPFKDNIVSGPFYKKMLAGAENYYILSNFIFY